MKHHEFFLEKHLTTYVAMYKDSLSMEYLSVKLRLGNFSKEQNFLSSKILSYMVATSDIAKPGPTSPRLCQFECRPDQ